MHACLFVLQEYGTASHLSRIGGVALLLLAMAKNHAASPSLLTIIEVLEHCCSHEKIAKDALDSNVLLFAQTQLRLVFILWVLLSSVAYQLPKFDQGAKIEVSIVCSLLRLLRQLANSARGFISISIFGG